MSAAPCQHDWSGFSSTLQPWMTASRRKPSTSQHQTNIPQHQTNTPQRALSPFCPTLSSKIAITDGWCPLQDLTNTAAAVEALVSLHLPNSRGPVDFNLNKLTRSRSFLDNEARSCATRKVAAHRARPAIPTLTCVIPCIQPIVGSHSAALACLRLAALLLCFICDESRAACFAYRLPFKLA